MKRPFHTIRDQIYSTVVQSKEDIKFRMEQIDKLMVWIVGFSIGGVSLIVSDIGKLHESFTYWIIKFVLVSLVISIISGIVFRVACYFISIYNSQIQVFIETSFSNEEMMEIDAEDLDSETDIEEILRRLRIDFGENAEHIVSFYEKVDLSLEQNQLYLLNDLKNHYKKVALWAKKDYEIAIDFAKDTMHKAYGYSRKQIDKQFEAKTGNKWQFWVLVAFISFITSSVTFVVVALTLSIAY